MHTFVPNPWPKPKFVLWNQWHQKCLHLPEKQNSNCSSHTHKDTYTECTCFLQSVYHLPDTIHALLASGDLILEEKHFIHITISTHIHKSMNTCKTLLRHTAHHKKKKEINTMHSCVQRHTYAYRNTSSISNSQNSLRIKHLIQTSRWMDMHYVVQNGFFNMVWHCGTICDLLTI